jgi:fructose-1-phosphate kinase PfkB-like protein
LEQHNVTYLDIEGKVRKAILINRENSSDSTVIVGKGSEISTKDWDAICEFLQSIVKKGEIVTIMGSLPNNSPKDGLAQISKIIQRLGGRVFVDSSPGIAFGRAVMYFLILYLQILKKLKHL